MSRLVRAVCVLSTLVSVVVLAPLSSASAATCALNQNGTANISVSESNADTLEEGTTVSSAPASCSATRVTSQVIITDNAPGPVITADSGVVSGCGTCNVTADVRQSITPAEIPGPTLTVTWISTMTTSAGTTRGCRTATVILVTNEVTDNSNC